jgi:hypothetical protein
LDDSTAATPRVPEAAQVYGEAPPGVPGADAESWAAVGSELAGRYYIHVDGSDPSRRVRYVAVARRIGVRPYAIVTPDLDELRRVARAGTRLGTSDA